MAEFAGIHIKRHVRSRRPFDEPKGRFGIDEAPNQPRRGHPVDAWTRTRHPTAFSKRCRRQRRRSDAHRFSSVSKTLERTDRASNVLPRGGLEKVDALNLGEALAHPTDSALPLVTIGCWTTALWSRP